MAENVCRRSAIDTARGITAVVHVPVVVVCRSIAMLAAKATAVGAPVMVEGAF